MDIITQLDFYNYVNDEDYINLLRTNKEYNKLLLDDNTYKLILYIKFSMNFVDKAKQIIFSWKDCYLRIKKFEHLTVKYSFNLWCEEDYFVYWKFKNIPITTSEVYKNYYRNY
uniref:Uncharacterized protein n=1 Tax=viral metagenome TaxID=1070528 RepID=A0A6C0LED2_9ZZZZ